ncbi:unnamed protein product [marine sediment metagenome]|uniref:Uncharacterized protein n=1 Tax=marine sediment metagenome TaxID=412755 RepID=X0VCM6_9ZZZZ
MVGRDDILGAVRPLRLVFWGGLLCALDAPIAWVSDGWGWRLDVLNDALGMVLIAVGVTRLGRIAVDEPWRDRYGSAMRVVKLVALLGVAEAVLGHFVFPHPPGLDVFLAIYQLTQLAAFVLYLLSVRRLCAKATLAGAARAWSTTLVLFVGSYAVPAMSYYYSTYLTLLGHGRDRSDPRLLAVLGQALMAIPMIHMAFAISRTAREADGL